MKQLSDFDKRMGLSPCRTGGIRFLDASDLTDSLEGLAWFKQEHIYRRLPREPKPKLSEAVNFLAWHSSGARLRFKTDSKRVLIRAERENNPIFDHMANTGVAGFDLYAGEPGREAFFKVARVDPVATQFTVELFASAERKMRSFIINFPLYARVIKVEVGIDEGSEILPPAPLADNGRPICVYGTSITHGGCASRPGMSWTNILSRRMNRLFYNFGFSGSGRGEPEVAELLAEVPADPAMYILDYEANSGGFEKYSQTLPEFIRILRAVHPATPILVVSRYRFTTSSFDPRILEMQKNTVEQFRRAGDKAIFFFDGSDMLGEDFGEALVDGCHATDIGFYRVADALQGVIATLLHRH
ncbi:MAG: SGNH/GDSL hydrolase family protein [Kiritimatiellae bacterium]|nr:SGNH/GDSL hydrolase family protein [Kiritimatiellia bacterium]